MHFKKVLKLFSSVMSFVAAIMLIPTIMALILHETPAFKSFAVTVTAIALVCAILKSITHTVSFDGLSMRDGFLFTTLTWIFAAAFGAIPPVMTKSLPHYSDAFFEIISGFTTTGATRIDNVEGCFKSILLWRALSNWLGGMGIVVLFVALLPAIGSGAGSFKLMGAETVGPVKGKLTSKTRSTAIILWEMYLGLTAAQILALSAGGLPLFDCITIAFSTVSTAGFSIKNNSIGAYGSAYIDVVVTIFMLMASLNFTLYFKVITGKIREVLHDTEFRVFFIIVGTAVFAGAFYLYLSKSYASFAQALRYMAFHVASVISTTGFATASIINWPTFALMILIALMFIGGCAGSTAGGIKVVRIHVLFQSACNSIRKKNHSNSVYTLKMNNEVISEDTVFSILTFVVIYIATWLISTVIISLTGASIVDCLSSTLLSLGNIGLGFGSKLFSSYPQWTNWVFSFLMLAGRLELLTVYVLFSRSFWKH